MKTKIIITIGPSSESPEVLKKLIGAGFDIARINFSHCTHPEFKMRKKLISAISKRAGKKVYLFQDLQGPRIRVGELPKEGREIREGESVIFTTKKPTGKEIFVDNGYLHVDIRVRDPIYLSNGEIELITKRVNGWRIYAEAVRGGVLYSRKPVNVPHTKLTISGLTAKDKRDLAFGLREGIDYLGVSFVQTAEDIIRAKKLVGKKAKVIAKIETALALKNIDSIIQASDGIMIGRGDLGIEVPVEQLPFIQKNLIRHAFWHGKPAITATQILSSMKTHPHPTRAEVSDIANAVFDGTDAIMLSDETASGGYPLEALQTLNKVVRQAEQYLNPENGL